LKSGDRGGIAEVISSSKDPNRCVRFIGIVGEDLEIRGFPVRGLWVERDRDLLFLHGREIVVSPTVLETPLETIDRKRETFIVSISGMGEVGFVLPDDSDFALEKPEVRCSGVPQSHRKEIGKKGRDGPVSKIENRWGNLDVGSALAVGHGGEQATEEEKKKS